MIVPRRLTPVSLAGLVDVLHAACHTALGQCPGARDVVAYAQLVEEHGVADGALRGVFGYNLGNIDATVKERADPSVTIFTTLPEHEGAGLHTWSSQHVRRAYACVEDGAAGYWTALVDRFEGAWEAMLDGGGEPAPEAFAKALKAGRYFTGDASEYARALERAAAQAQRGGCRPL